MLTRTALVAVLVAAALAVQAVFLHAVVASPLASATGALSRPAHPAPVATFEEDITVVATPATPATVEPRPAS
jgi:hypothetical protein